MRAIMLAAALVSGCGPVTNRAVTPEGDRGTLYLASIAAIPLADGERLTAFEIDTWGVEFEAVCHLPAGWRITAGSSANPSGTIAGEGSHGVTWLTASNAGALENLLLVRISGQVRAAQEGPVPPTFVGRATIDSATDEEPLMRPLTSANVRLTPAARCPERRP